jgi:hypothetical protein
LSIDGTAHTVRAAEPIFYLVRRGCEPGTLDHALKTQAQEAGVMIRFGERGTPALRPRTRHEQARRTR